MQILPFILFFLHYSLEHLLLPSQIFHIYANKI